jgi:peptide/nickel transport system substrate-binding protein
MRHSGGFLAAALLAATLPGLAAAQSLTIATGGAATSLDPHFFNAAPNSALTAHLFDRLVDRDHEQRVVPHLAESWRRLSDTEWEFTLRRGVTWHDGRPFTADDVVFTFARAPNVPNSPGGFGPALRSVKEVQALDATTLRLVTHYPNPILLPELGGIHIVSRHVGAAATTEDYNSGRAAIGTGPYRLAQHRPGDRTDFTRHEGWWGGTEPWARVAVRFVPTDPARTAALLAGDVDLIDQVSPTDLPRLRRDARVAIHETGSLRIVHIGPDWSRSGPLPHVTDNAGQPLPVNPFQDLRVRRALNVAINRDAIVERAMDGLGTTTAQWLPAGTYSYDPATRPVAYDPSAARRLLAEAGYPQGFRLTLHTMNDRFPNDVRVAQAVAQMWSRVGVQTAVEALPWASYSARAARQEFSMSMGSWGSTTGEGLSYLVSVLASFDREARTGAANHRRVSDPELDALMRQASATMDDAAREAVLHQAVRRYADQVWNFPILHLGNVWASRRGLTYVARKDERTAAMGLRAAR